jgi:hypothetical protein
MEHRPPRSDLQRQVETYLQGCLGQDVATVRDFADVLVTIARDHDENNPVRALFRAAHATAVPSVPPLPPPPAIDESATPPAVVRHKGSKLSLRFSRKNDKDKLVATHHSGDSASASTSEGTSWRKPAAFFSRPSTAAGRPPTSYPLQQTVSNSTLQNGLPEYVHELHKHGLIDKHDVLPADQPPSRKVESDATDEKRGFFTFTTSPKRSKGKAKTEAEPPAPSEYSCVFCEKSDKTYSSKGTCKRHLEEMHVAKKYLQCNECHHKSNTVPDARKHAAQCSPRQVGWTQVKPGQKKLYSSEFTDAVFESQQMYVEHLLELCAKPIDQRPRLSWHTKLRNLLTHELPADYLREVSSKMLGDPEAWRSARWEFEPIHRAVRELESGILDRELNPNDMLRLHRRKAFVEELFASRVRNASTNSRPVDRPTKVEDMSQEEEAASSSMIIDAAPAYPNQQLDEGQQMIGLQTGYNHVANTYFSPQAESGATGTPPEPTTKRPLSYETATAVPIRYPPGPSPATLQTSDSQIYRDVYNQALGYTAPPPTSGTISPAFSSSPWPMHEQPPPYDPNMVASTGYPTPMQSQHPSQVPNEVLDLPPAAQYTADIPQTNSFGQLSLQQNPDMLQMYSTTAPPVLPANSGHEGTMFGNFSTPHTTAEPQMQWNGWFDASQPDPSTFANGFNGNFSNQQ